MLKSTCVYGIYFEKDKLELNAESAPTLKEIASLLESAGMTARVASNESEEGRAKNRRVVLVKLN